MKLKLKMSGPRALYGLQEAAASLISSFEKEAIRDED